MIGFNHLGQHGRLGNQMFQYAALRGIAAAHDYDFCIPQSDFVDEWKDHQLFETFKLPHNNNRGYQLQPDYYQEKQFHYDQEYVDNCPDQICLFGYFQTERYFENITDSIREDFTFHDEIVETCTEFIGQVDNPLALHVRRTDYVSKAADHPPCSAEYYQEALSKFDDDRSVIVFSDDAEWCKEQSIFSADRFMVAEGNDNRYDLCLMSLCKDFIIANSSFSWWGAWLANRGGVVAPARWFGEGYTAKNDTRDIVPSNWLKV
jgi:hypothetical protein|tara:strand:- start:1543 stop:2328 length:786 start_codon:yes stop_codon:yes gene_type:complete